MNTTNVVAFLSMDVLTRFFFYCQQVSRILRYEILKEGYLFKTGTNAKGAFRKRWMLLDPLCLMYFKDPLVKIIANIGN